MVVFPQHLKDFSRVHAVEQLVEDLALPLLWHRLQLGLGYAMGAAGKKKKGKNIFL